MSTGGRVAVDAHESGMGGRSDECGVTRFPSGLLALGGALGGLPQCLTGGCSTDVGTIAGGKGG